MRGCVLRAPPAPLTTPAGCGAVARRPQRAAARHAAPCRATARDAAPAFDSAAFDADRLAKDAVARDEAAAAMAAQPGAWKWAVRKRIWDTLEKTDAADFPRPVHHRIPNFKGAEAAAALLTALPEFVSASCIKARSCWTSPRDFWLTLTPLAGEPGHSAARGSLRGT